MVCMNTSRLKIGRLPGREGLGHGACEPVSHRGGEPCRLGGHEARQSRNQRRIFDCPIAKRGRMQMRFPGLKARKVIAARGGAQRSPAGRPSICPRPVRPEHRCIECAGGRRCTATSASPSAASGDAIPFPESVGHRPIPPAERGRGRCSATALPPRFGRWSCDRCRPFSLPGWFRRERCRRFALPPQSKMLFHIAGWSAVV